MTEAQTAPPLEPVSRMKVRVAPYFSESPTVLTLGINEIVAEKMRALLQRKKPRDVFDIWFLIQEKGIKLENARAAYKMDRISCGRLLSRPVLLL